MMSRGMGVGLGGGGGWWGGRGYDQLVCRLFVNFTVGGLRELQARMIGCRLKQFCRPIVDNPETVSFILCKPRARAVGWWRAGRSGGVDC